MTELIQLQSKAWQVGILPQTGASVAYGRVRYSGNWVDVLRPTDEADYGNSSSTSSFIMMPWANRIKDARFTFEGTMHQLHPTPDDGTARHGVVRKLPWVVGETSETLVQLTFDSTQHEVNFPFAFNAAVQYQLSDDDFTITTSITNTDDAAFPAGFGHHPYFVKPTGANAPQLQIPCEAYYEMTNSIPTHAAKPVTPENDFRFLRTLQDEDVFDDLLTGRDATQPIQIVYPAWGIQLAIHADVAYKHVILFVPQSKAFFALEPQTNANDGFNLLANGVMGHGVFVLQPNETKRVTFSLNVSQMV